MPLLTWKEEYSLNIPSLDSQHGVLIAIINQLHDAIENGREHSVTGFALDELMLYVSGHFDYEEKLMRHTGYPGLKEHVQEHEAFRQKAAELFRQFHAGVGDNYSQEVMAVLENWFKNHLLGTDRAIAAHLITHGVT